MNRGNDVAIIGASLAGVTVAENLRARGFEGGITLYGDEPHPPYDRPPLSKAVLSEPDGSIDRLLLKPQSWYGESGVALELGNRVETLDAARRTFTVGGHEVSAENIVIATGSSPRRLPTVCDDDSVFYLRTWDDATRFSAKLAVRGRLVIIGAGFIGLEVAASAAARGWTVTLLEYAPRPLTRVLPPELGELCTSYYQGSGVELRTGIEVTQVVRRGGELISVFADGEELAADAIVVAAGGVPNTEWLRDSGLDMDNGILCDSFGNTSVPGIYAAGDVARWHNEFTCGNARVEQWQAVLEQSSIVAAALMGQPVAGWKDAPYFWSDLVGGRVQFIGTSSPHSPVHTVISGEKAVAVLGDAEGRLTGVLSRNHPKAIVRARRLLTEPTSFAEAGRWADDLMRGAPVTV